jgi:hypothetical protein
VSVAGNGSDAGRERDVQDGGANSAVSAEPAPLTRHVTGSNRSSHIGTLSSMSSDQQRGLSLTKSGPCCGLRSIQKEVWCYAMSTLMGTSCSVSRPRSEGASTVSGGPRADEEFKSDVATSPSGSRASHFSRPQSRRGSRSPNRRPAARQDQLWRFAYRNAAPVDSGSGRGHGGLSRRGRPRL